MKKSLAAIPALVLLLACSLAKPPIYIYTRLPVARQADVQTAHFAVQPLGKLDIRNFKRALVKRYGSREAFAAAVQKDLAEALAPEAAPGAPTFRLELGEIRVDSHTVGYTTTSYMAGMPMTHHHTDEYCEVLLSYRVSDEQGAVLMQGGVAESTKKGEFLRPNQTKLANAVAGARRHLVDYLRGRMAPEHIGVLSGAPMPASAAPPPGSAPAPPAPAPPPGPSSR